MRDGSCLPSLGGRTEMESRSGRRSYAMLVLGVHAVHTWAGRE